MGKKRPARLGNPDLRHQTQVPAPPIEAIEKQIWNWLSPEHFKPLSSYAQQNQPKLRERVLTLPVMMAVVLSLVYRRIPGLSEVIRILNAEGLFGFEPLKVSKQALSKRLMKLPASLFAQLWEQVINQIQTQVKNSSLLAINCHQAEIVERFACVWIADGSTLEQLRKKLKALSQQPEKILAGKMMMVVEAFTHLPVTYWYTDNAKASDQKFSERLLESLPSGGLLIFDLGFFNFTFFDQFSIQRKFFLTRLKNKTAYSVVRCLERETYYKDEIILMGLYRSNPCRDQVRLVSVLWGQHWYYYLTNVLEPEMLTPQQVCELYRRRWRVEDAFKLTKRLLGLSYIWVGDRNGVEIQILATSIFYAVLNQLCVEVAIALNQPLENISVEMVFRSLYHFARALLRDETTQLISYLTEHEQLFGLVKARRSRHRQIDEYTQLIWGSTS